MALFAIKVTLLLKMTVKRCFHSDSDILNLFKAKSELISLRFFYRCTDSFLKFSTITILVRKQLKTLFSINKVPTPNYHGQNRR